MGMSRACQRPTVILRDSVYPNSTFLCILQSLPLLFVTLVPHGDQSRLFSLFSSQYARVPHHHSTQQWLLSSISTITTLCRTQPIPRPFPFLADGNQTANSPPHPAKPTQWPISGIHSRYLSGLTSKFTTRPNIPLENDLLARDPVLPVSIPDLP